MNVVSRSPKILLMLSVLAGPMAGSLSAQEPQSPPEADVSATVSAPPPSEAPAAAAEETAGPEIKGFISARSGDRVQITTADGTNTTVAVTEATRIRASKGLFGLDRAKLTPDYLINGLPVTVRTVQSGGGLVASHINLQNKDIKTASMIRSGTAQGFAEQTQATQELRGRMGDIDQYNIKSTTHVNFDTGKAVLSAQAKNDLCAAASQADGIKNALLLVVGYTDSTGSVDFNQRLSEKRAGNVVNHLQQACGWKPYRMLTPTGMAEADPLASNDTFEGKSQNRRVAVNILVSKGLDGL